MRRLTTKDREWFRGSRAPTPAERSAAILLLDHLVCEVDAPANGQDAKGRECRERLWLDDMARELGVSTAANALAHAAFCTSLEPTTFAYAEGAARLREEWVLR